MCVEKWVEWMWEARMEAENETQCPAELEGTDGNLTPRTGKRD